MATMQELADAVKKKVDNLLVAANARIAEAEKLNPTKTLGGVKTLMPYPELNFSGKVSYSWTSDANQAEQKIKVIEIWFEQCKAVKAANALPIEDNKKVLAAAMAFMKSLGVSPSEYYYKTSRSKYRDSRTAGWVLALQASIPCADGWNQVESQYKSQMESCKRVIADAEKKQQELEKQREQEIKNREGERKIGALAAKYGLDATLAEGDEVLTAILSKNKYLRLAHYLCKNRGDWNDGCSYAEHGLNGFEVASEIDQKIYENINSHIENWDGDGRIFRDCEYNYGVLFGMVAEQNPDLNTDYNLIVQLIGVE